MEYGGLALGGVADTKNVSLYGSKGRCLAGVVHMDWLDDVCVHGITSCGGISIR